MSLNIVYLISNNQQKNKIKNSIIQENEYLNLVDSNTDINNTLLMLNNMNINKIPIELETIFKEKMHKYITENVKNLTRVNPNNIFYFDITSALKKKDIKEYVSITEFNPYLAKYLQLSDTKNDNNNDNNNDEDYNDNYDNDDCDYDDDENNEKDIYNFIINDVNKFPNDLPSNIVFIIDYNNKEGFSSLLNKAKIGKSSIKILYMNNYELISSIIKKRVEIL